MEKIIIFLKSISTNVYPNTFIEYYLS